MTPIGLRCEHVVAPLGVDNRTPRFSWHNLDPRRSARQSAYQIIVSADAESVRKGVGTLWDSGKVRSADQFGISYAGKPLRSFSRYYWRVRAWDERGKEGRFGEISTFETGAFDSRDWSAKWITQAHAEGTPSLVHKISEAAHNRKDLQSRHIWALYFAKAFLAERKIVRARAYVCGLGYYEVELNGRRVGDHLLDPGQTDYETGALYSAYDIGGMLHPGKNVVLFCLANGRHIDAYGYPNPRGVLQILIEYSDGSRTTVGTDETWLSSYGPVRENGIYLGETYDAREEAKIDALKAAALKELSRGERPHLKATRKNGAAIKVANIGKPLPLRPQLMPPIRARRELPAFELTNPKPGVYIYDFGQNFAGVIRLKVEGPRGTRIELRYAELIGAQGELHVGTNREAPASDTYILKGEGLEIFQPRFTYHGFRYVRVSGFPGTPSIDAVQAVVLHTDLEQTGSFTCSDPLINKIHENVLWSGKSNLMSIPTDCPQRGERMGWLGDAQLASEQAMCNYDMAAFYVKYLEDIRLSQKKDGSLSDVTPAYWPLYPGDPAWTTAYVTLAWHMYFTYGDTAILEIHYEPIKRYLDFLAKESDGHIIRRLGKYGDWCPPASRFPKQTPIELTSTWYHYHDTLLFSRIAKVLGKEDDSKRYAARAGEILEAFNKEFLKEEGRYATLQMSPIDHSPGQTSQTLPLFLDMVPKKVHAAAVETLVKTITDDHDSHVDTGIVGTRYLFEVLRNEGHTDLAYRMITQKSYPGWGYMIERGATTIWERWEELTGLGMNSHNHIMLGTVDAWFYRTLAGIRQSAPLWRKAIIEPYHPGELTHASARVGTLYGALESSWARQPGSFTLDLKVPVGIEATVRIPRGVGRARLLESGKRVAAFKEDGERYTLTVGPGVYHFERKDL